MNPQDHQNQIAQNFRPIQNYSFFYNTLHMPYQFSHPCAYNAPQGMFFQRQMPPVLMPDPQHHQKQQQPKVVITISSDEEEVHPKPQEQAPKPVAKPPPQPKKQPKILDLDQLESQGRVYDYESSASPQLPRRVSKGLNFQKTMRQMHYENFQSPKQKKKPQKIRKEPTRIQPKIAKQVQIGRQRQLIVFPQSNVKTRLIRVYTKNEEKCTQYNIFETVQKLYNIILQNFPNVNDEDVVRILNFSGKSYKKAINFVQENGFLVQYLIETYQNNILSSEEESKNKK
ncbi:unnamed protein product (macronuclear) [Paramecium tetraurelia]|uniref:CUE domain-containing protein n=1 Tax=Paramecium tetraurelia TaxID=5888 RepID=A0CEV9_PARTE|nr:uncharacterized protein GSPATT00037765001 [Paramecium tetraurelia]CAK69326.1 unnamed protein product [Paramecium tetraurelia]|eukprot:XP_001436723.1 hypothetical protein (macronuclear) [Paramecium tetraurelia strain d4-2]